MKKYEAPEAEMIRFEAQDVITISVELNPDQTEPITPPNPTNPDGVAI